MSRIGRAPITVPEGVEIEMREGHVVHVKGPKGELEQRVPERMIVDIRAGEVRVSRPTDAKDDRCKHGLTRTLVNNMVVGVTEQFRKRLEVNGVGYRAAKSGKTLTLTIGKSHPVTFSETDEIKVEVPTPNEIVVIGCDKQKVGEFAANIRKQRPVEPYKGKGIKYDYEHVRRKEGKTGSKK
ncbi:MAG: 50S ribosomal protein L6 [Clostridiales bacterium]|jgi:large subunit ribosomal protein L6|nr:50S ribosomal protein L6 [Clostridiales bacterium]